MKSELSTKIILGLSLIPGFGFRRIKKLFDIFCDWEKIWHLNYNDIKNIFGENLAKIFIERKDKINIYEEFEKYEKTNIDVITYYDDIYPKLLKETYSPPLIIFAIGNIHLLKNKNFLSVIGSRKYTQYGKYVVEKLISQISKQNITVVSGLAIGIDSFAHIEALKECGSTIAVLGSAINEIYPKSNINLSKQIEKYGLIISELPIGTKYAKENFPQRNRIIAGLSQATLIIEAGQRSGALITANYAINENREILTIPGSILEKNYEGNNYLIKQGAKIITDIEDILETYNIITEKNYNEHNDPIFEEKEQKIIYEILKDGPLNLDKIIINSRLNVNIVIASLTKMELSNLIQNIGNQTYKIRSN